MASAINEEGLHGLKYIYNINIFIEISLSSYAIMQVSCLKWSINIQVKFFNMLKFYIRESLTSYLSDEICLLQ